MCTIPFKKLSELKRRVSDGREPEQGRFPMLLRDHPLFNHRKVPSWPPTWTWVSGLDNKHPLGEIGILRDVLPSRIKPADRCFLYMDFDGASYIGCLLIDDIAFCRQIVELLLANRNETIADIGSLDLSSTV